MEIIRIGNFYMTASIAQLTEAAAKAGQEFGDVVKDVTNPFFRSTYADLSNFITATRPQLGKYGLVLWQAPQTSEVGAVITTMLTHTSGELIAFDLDMPAAKQDAQGYGSAITYGRRYGYGPMLNVAGEVDDDGNAAVASRKEHLEKLDQKMEGQERITPAQVRAFERACDDHGRTADQVRQFLDELNGYVQVIEIQKQDYQRAIKWALNQPADTDLIGDLTSGLQQAQFKKLYAAANKKRVSNDDLHQHIEEQYQVKSAKQLTFAQFNQVLNWLESVTPAG